MEDKNYITFIVGQLLKNHLAQFRDEFVGNKYEACARIADEVIAYNAKTRIADEVGWYEAARRWLYGYETMKNWILNYYCIETAYEDMK